MRDSSEDGNSGTIWQAIVIALVVVLCTVARLAAGWVGAEEILSVSGDYEVLTRIVAQRDADMIRVGQHLVAFWASAVDEPDDEPGIVVAEQTADGSGWTQSAITDTLTAWSPSAAAAGDSYVLAWVHGDNPDVGDQPRDLVLYDGNGKRQLLMQGVYGVLAPHVASDATGDYVVFAAAQQKGAYRQPDLYYAHRPAGTEDWPAPKLIVGHDAASPGCLVAGIYQPHLAVTDGGTVHIVWQQWEVANTGTRRDAIYHVTGTPQFGGQMTWSEPVKLSPDPHAHAVMPAIYAADNGTVHITWSVGSGVENLEDDQNVYHRRLGSGRVTKLNPMIIHANKNFPNWIASDIAAVGDTVCVAWHGYIGTQGSDYEKAYFQCSEDGGVTWGREVQVSETAQRGAMFPSIITDGSRRVHITWIEYQVAETTTLAPQAVTAAVPQGVYYRAALNNHEVSLPLVMRSR